MVGARGPGGAGDDAETRGWAALARDTLMDDDAQALGAMPRLAVVLERAEQFKV
jgi:hypothetical protein